MKRGLLLELKMVSSGILPNRVIQPIAEHSEYLVERLAFSHDRKFLGSISHDSILKMWDIDSLLQDSGKKVEGKSASDSDDEDMGMDTDNAPPKLSKGRVLSFSNVSGVVILVSQ
ncbi:putative transcription factor WD40-like family [Helianthus anomalus]